MAGKHIHIDESNIYEWMCSTGHLLPTNDIELVRFERLFPVGSIEVDASRIDPFAILNGSWKRERLSVELTIISGEEQENMRMAARKHGELPKDILDQIRKNQEKKKDDHGDDQ